MTKKEIAICTKNWQKDVKTREGRSDYRHRESFAGVKVYYMHMTNIIA